MFKTTITEDQAFTKIEEVLNTDCEYDGYFSVADDDGETPLSWGPSMSAEEFLANVREMLEVTWKAARFWAVYDRREDRGDPDAIAMRNAAFRITRGYTLEDECAYERDSKTSDEHILSWKVGDQIVIFAGIVADGYRVTADVEKHQAILSCRLTDGYSPVTRIILSRDSRRIEDLPFGSIPLIRVTAISEAEIEARDQSDEWAANAAKYAVANRQI